MFKLRHRYLIQLFSFPFAFALVVDFVVAISQFVYVESRIGVVGSVDADDLPIIYCFFWFLFY